MTKRSGLVLVLSVLLCISMLFVSCESGNTDTTATDTSETVTETAEIKKEPIPQDEKIDYVSIFDQWNEYISYASPEEEDAMGAEKLYTNYADGTLISRRDRGMFYEVTFEYVGYTPGTTVKLFNKATGDQIGGNYVDLVGSGVNYYFNYVGCVVEIATVTYGEEDVITYDYYDANGKKLNEEAVSAEERYELFEKTASQYEVDGYSFVVAGETVYLLFEGEIVHVFEHGKEIVLPATNYEYGEYTYFIPDPEDYENNALYVIDSNGTVCANYTLSYTYDERNCFILANGNVLVSYVTYCDEEEALYTYENIWGEKVLLYNVIVDITTGKATAVPATYAVETLVTPFDSENYNVVLNGNYQYAEIFKIVDGKLSVEKTSVILDNDMTVLSELPNAVKNQTAFLGMSDNETLLVEGSVIYEGQRGGMIYRVSANGVELYVNETAFNDYGEPLYELVENGFTYNGTLYNSDMQPLYELSMAEEYSILNNGQTILVKEKDETNDEQYLIKLLMIENGELKSVTLADETDTVEKLVDGANGFIVTVVDEFEVEEGEDEIPPEVSQVLYSNNGDMLLSGDTVNILSFDGEAYLISCVNEGITSYYVVR